MSNAISCPIIQIGNTVIQCQKCPFYRPLNLEQCAWRKIKGASQKQRGEQPASPQSTNLSYEGTIHVKVYNLDWIRDMTSKVKCYCGAQFQRTDIMLYPSDYGVLLDGFTGKFDVNANCRYCRRSVPFRDILRCLGVDE